MSELHFSLKNSNFTELDYDQLLNFDGGIDWWAVGKSAVQGAVIGSVSTGLTFAGAGTVALPVIGTVGAGTAGAIVGGIGGAAAGAISSIWKQLW